MNTLLQQKPQVNLCTIGIEGSGKTTLTADILKATRGRGLRATPPEQLDMGSTKTCQHVEFETEKRRYSLTDIPANPEHLTDMIASTCVM
ncbi:MAG: GTP-binding protein, partial [Chloroflexota bacterium]